MQTELCLHDAAVALDHPLHELVATVTSVRTSDQTANKRGKVHVAYFGLSVIPGLVVPPIFLHSQVERKANVLQTPLQASIPDSWECENT